MLSVYKRCTSQPPTCSPLPLLLGRQSLALPLAEGLSIIPAHLNHREVQALPDAWARSCRLSSRGSREWEEDDDGMLRNIPKIGIQGKTHLSPKHPFYRQPPRSGLAGKDEKISQKSNLFTRQLQSIKSTKCIAIVYSMCSKQPTNRSKLKEIK